MQINKEEIEQIIKEMKEVGREFKNNLEELKKAIDLLRV